MSYTSARSSFGDAAASREAARARLDRVAHALDAAVRVPGTNFRFGADAALNVIPGLGPIASKAVSAWLIWEARRLGAPGRLIARMVGNVALDAAIGVVPLAGWVADAFFRANTRNMALLRAYLDGPAR
jgi:predicted signal transduction protein with EAL and GGDEF domain